MGELKVMKYFDFSEWTLDEIIESLRRRIYEASQPIPNKVMKHSVSIIYRLSESSYTYPNYGCLSFRNLPKFADFNEAAKYLNSLEFLERDGENFWIEVGETDTYKDEDGRDIFRHYEINEYDYEEYEDGLQHTEYTEKEREKLSETLYMLEKLKVYLKVYDDCCDNYDFGNGTYAEEIEDAINKFENEYVEDLSDLDYDEEESDI